MVQSQLIDLDEEAGHTDVVQITATWETPGVYGVVENSIYARIVYMGEVHTGQKWAVFVHAYVAEDDAYEHAFCSSLEMARRLVQIVIDEASANDK